jgi:L-threonylcarbamoyladenylate synthase
MAKECASEWPNAAELLAKAFWPGPLTLVVPHARRIPDMVTAGGNTVGIRWPSHPFIQAVIRECGFPLAAPSANPSNQISPTNVEHVRKHLEDKIPLIVDGGQSQVGIESTVVDVSVSPPRLLRPGMIHAPALMAITGELHTGSAAPTELLKSPGLLPKHYAPRAKLVVLTWQDEADLKAQSVKAIGHQPKNRPGKRIHIIAHTHIPSGEGFARVSVIPHDPEAFARAFYGELHLCDEAGADLIVVEALPETSEWFAIADRLRRAAAS